MMNFLSNELSGLYTAMALILLVCLFLTVTPLLVTSAGRRLCAEATPGGAEDVDRCSAACARACMVALEEKVGNRFEAKFRKRSVWQRGLYGEALISGNQFTGGRCPDKFEGK